MLKYILNLFNTACKESVKEKIYEDLSFRNKPLAPRPTSVPACKPPVFKQPYATSTSRFSSSQVNYSNTPTTVVYEDNTPSLLPTMLAAYLVSEALTSNQGSSESKNEPVCANYSSSNDSCTSPSSYDSGSSYDSSSSSNYSSSSDSYSSSSSDW